MNILLWYRIGILNSTEKYHGCHCCQFPTPEAKFAMWNWRFASCKCAPKLQKKSHLSQNMETYHVEVEILF